MAEILAEIYSWISFVPKITFKNLIEIAIIAILVYEMLIWIKNTRAWTLLKGIIFILAFFLAAAILELDTILWLLEKTSYIAVTAIIVIFEHNTPLHDGAVVIRGNRVTAATCYLPLSDNMDISKALGTRHRAAVGVSEATDSVTLVVSEETGRVSVAVSGRLKSVKDGDELRDMLSVLVKRETENTGRFRIWKGRRRNERKADE